MNSRAIIENIRQLANDPLGIIFIAEYPTTNGVIRWDGTVCYRRNGEDYFTFGMEPSAFLAAVEQSVQSDGVQACPVCLLELDSDGMCPKCFGQYAPRR